MLAPYVLHRLLARRSPGLLLEVPSPSGLLTRVASSLLKGVYNPKAFFPHAASLRQAFAHCARFPTAASRRSLGRVSVPVWLIVLSDQLRIVALVGLYPANKLIRRELIPSRKRQTLPFPFIPEGQMGHPVLIRVSPGYPSTEGGLLTCYSPVRRCPQSRRTGSRSTCMC